MRIINSLLMLAAIVAFLYGVSVIYWYKTTHLFENKFGVFVHTWDAHLVALAALIVFYITAAKAFKHERV